MTIRTVLMAVCLAFGFAGWPIIGSYSRANGAWVGTMACVASLIVVGLLSLRQMVGATVPTARTILLLFFAGAINGIAVYFYSAKVTDPTVPTAAFVAMTAMLVVVAALILGWLFKGAVPSSRQLLGFVFAIMAIYFLGR